MVFLRLTLPGFLLLGLLCPVFAIDTQPVDNQYVITNSPQSLGVTFNDFFDNQSRIYYPHAVLTHQSSKSTFHEVVITVDDDAKTNENTAVFIKILDNDSDLIVGIDPTSVDLDLGSLGIQNTFSVGEGDFEVDASGIVKFTPSLNYSGLFSIKYTVNDNLGITSNAAAINITVNDSPIANGDNSATLTNQAITFNVTSNDSDSDGSIDVASVDLDVNASNIQGSITTSAGTFSVTISTGDVTYTPALDFYGTATLPYTVRDNEGAVSNQATITIQVNKPPVAVNDNLSTTKNTTATINVTTNDTDVDGSLDLTKVDLNTAVGGVQNSINTAWGTFTVNTVGVVTYVPLATYTGTFTLPYVVSDNQGAVSNEALINVLVNDPPVASNDAVNANENTAITFKITTNDTDSDGTIDVTTIDLNTTVAGIQSSNTTTQGVFSATALGDVTFTPALNFNGLATLNYTVNDNRGAQSNIATIVVTVNNSPVANNDAASTGENVAVTFSVTANDTDSDGSIVVSTVDLDVALAGIQTSRTTAQGTFTVASSGDVTYTPATNFTGTATTTYTVNDNKGATSNTATVSVSINSAPVAGNDSGITSEDTPINIDIIANDSDADGSLVINTIDLNTTLSGNQSTITTAQGVFTVNTTTGLLTYTPTLNFNGTANLTYTIRDNKNLISNVATLTITVNAVNDAPVITGQLALNVDEDQSITLQLSNLTVSDPDDFYPTGFSIVIATGSNYTLSGNTVTPLPNFSGTLTIPVKVNDGKVNSAVFNLQVVVNPVNDAPSFDFLSDLVVSENAPTQNITITGISSGPLESQSLSLKVTSSNTSLIPNPLPATNIGTATSKVISFTPVASQTGTATITVSVIDPGLSEFTRTFQVQVVSINDAPTLNALAPVTMQEDVAQLDVALSGITAGPSENQAITVVASSTNASLFETLTVQYVSPQTFGTLHVKPKANAYGTATVTVTVTDDGISAPPSVNTFARTFTVTVNAVNDAPTITGQQPLSIAEDQPITLQLSNLVVVDPDDVYPTGFSMQVSAGANYTVAGNTITPALNFSGTLTISSITVNDGKVNSDPYKTLEITVNPVNDAPTLDGISNVTFQEDGGQQDITLSGITAGGNESQPLTLTKSATNTTLFEVLDLVYTSPQTTATLKLKPKANAYGTATVTVTVTDDGSGSGPNVNLFSRTFAVTINAINDSPEFKSTPFVTAIIGELFTDSIKVEDIDDATILLSAVTKPAWLTFTVNSTGKKATLSGTPPVGSGGKVSIQLQAKDVGAPILQNYEITIDARPTVAPFALATNEDIALPFTVANFTNAFIDSDGNAVTEIEITTLPRHGILKLNSDVINVGTKIATPSIPSLAYIPTADYHGKDTLYWKGSDGLAYSLASASVSFVIKPVNDAPVINAIEETPLVFEIGKDKVKLTSLFSVIDVDGDSLVRAEIGFRRENYNGTYDALAINKTTVPSITGSFDVQAGTLLLTGKASVADYMIAIRSIEYTYSNVLSPELKSKSVYFTVSDGKVLSNTVDREIKLIFTFQDLEIVNGFTPNGDGVNDVWAAIKQEREPDLAESVIRIYSKQGVLVFEGKGFEKKWDGTYKGQLLPADSYFYTIDVVDSKLKSLKKPYKGVVTILHDKDKL